MKQFDLVVIGGGPGGYVAAIRAAQLGKSVALIEKDKLGGVCLNKGCIPTKAIIKAAHAVHEMKEFKNLGINVEGVTLDAEKAITRAEGVSNRVSKGVALLMKKNKIEVFSGEAAFKSSKLLTVKSESGVEEVEASNIIVATGASYKSFPGLEHDGDRLIGAYEALKMKEMPESIAVIGAGAIGVEFSYFWNAFGVKVHIFELLDHLLPIEDEDSSKEVERAYRKYGIKTTLGLESLSVKNDGSKVVLKCLDKKGKEEEMTFDKALIAVGMKGNIEGYGLEVAGVETDYGFIKTDEFGKTCVSNIYAIGDVSGLPLLAHVASHQGVIAVEKMFGLNPHALDMSTIPGCTYCSPQVASVGMTERELKEKEIEYTVGKLPFIGNGKAVASNEKSGFVKVLIGADDKLLGAHIVGEVATELLHEFTLMKHVGLTAEQLGETIHPHPTLGEWLAEAVLLAKGRAINF